MYGRHGEAPLPIVAAMSPAHCFYAAIEAARIAFKYRTPVILLSDGYLANGAEPWRLPDVDVAARHLACRSPPSRPHLETARLLAVPARSRDARASVGDPGHAGPRAPHRRAREGRRHRQHLLRPRQPRAHDPAARRQGRGHRQRHPAPSRSMPTSGAELLVLGWGSTWGSIAAAVRRIRARGHKVAHAHLVHLNPFPRTSARCCAATAGARARDEPGPALAAGPGRVPRRRAVGEQGAGPAVQGRPRSKPPCSRARSDGTMTDTADPVTTTQGLDQRPGGPLVPGLRRLLDPHRGAAAHARARRAPREHGVRVGHRLRGPLPVLHEHLRHALRSTAGRRRSRPASRWPAPTSTCG